MALSPLLPPLQRAVSWREEKKSTLGVHWRYLPRKGCFCVTLPCFWHVAGELLSLFRAELRTQLLPSFCRRDVHTDSSSRGAEEPAGRHLQGLEEDVFMLAVLPKKNLDGPASKLFLVHEKDLKKCIPSKRGLNGKPHLCKK